MSKLHAKSVEGSLRSHFCRASSDCVFVTSAGESIGERERERERERQRERETERERERERFYMEL